MRGDLGTPCELTGGVVDGVRPTPGRTRGGGRFLTKLNHAIQFHQKPSAAACLARCRPYAVDDPACQPRHRPQDATHRVDASDALSTRSVPPIPLRRRLRELRRVSASSSGRFTASPTKPVRSELRLDVHSISLAEHR